MCTTLDDLRKAVEYLPLHYPILLGFEDCIWYKDGDTIYWNTDRNKEDLYDQKENSFSAYMPEGYEEYGGYLVANLDTQTGTLCTSIFKCTDQVTPPEGGL